MSIFGRTIIIDEDGTWRYATPSAVPDLDPSLRVLLVGSQWSPGLLRSPGLTDPGPAEMAAWSGASPMEAVVARMRGITSRPTEAEMPPCDLPTPEPTRANIYCITPPNIGERSVSFAAARHNRFPSRCHVEAAGARIAVTHLTRGTFVSDALTTRDAVTIVAQWNDGHIESYAPRGVYGPSHQPEMAIVDYAATVSQPADLRFRSLGELLDYIVHRRTKTTTPHAPLFVEVEGTDSIDVALDPVTMRPLVCVLAMDTDAAGPGRASQYYTTLQMTGIRLYSSDPSVTHWNPRLSLLEISGAKFDRLGVGISPSPGTVPGVVLNESDFDLPQDPIDGKPAPVSPIQQQHTDHYYIVGCTTTGAGFHAGTRVGCTQRNLWADPIVGANHGDVAVIDETIEDVDPGLPRLHHMRLRISSPTPFAFDLLGPNGGPRKLRTEGRPDEPVADTWDAFASQIAAATGAEVEIVNLPPDLYDYGPRHATIGPVAVGQFASTLRVVSTPSGDHHVAAIYSANDVHSDGIQAYPSSHGGRGRLLVMDVRMIGLASSVPPIFLQHQGAGGPQNVTIAGLFVSDSPPGVRQSTLAGQWTGSIVGVVLPDAHRITLQPADPQYGRPAFEAVDGSRMEMVHAQIVDRR